MAQVAAAARPAAASSMSVTSPYLDPDNPFLPTLIEQLRRHPKRVVFPEGNDVRILRVAAELARLECVSPILLGKRREIESTADLHGVPMEFIGVVHPEDSSDFPAYVARYRRISKIRRQAPRHPHETMAMPHYFAAMMAQYGAADAVVGGNQIFPAAFFRAMLHVIKRFPQTESVSSCMAAWLRHRPDLGADGVVFLTDCAVTPSPTVAQLACSAVETAKSLRALLGVRPRVAMLSFSTHGSTRTPGTEKMRAATALVRKQAGEQSLEMDVDGELELDAALLPGPAEHKAPRSLVAGRANILTFPDLNSAHIACKLLEHIGGAQCYGQMVLGLSRPAVQISRVESEHAIFGAAICAAHRALLYRELIANEPWDE
jgi:phosphotransacetylase